ncbi:MAG: acetate--CoA ligase family protein, partial [Dehalococcoidia bacterium]|nr:acetate--CoA ligase family protein [Dehalococcoidia bacterium]
KLDLKELDLLPLLFEDEQTDIICLYMEGIDRGRELLEVARRSPKPILVYKGNISQASARIARSHTAAMASDKAVTEAALRQAGMIRVDRIPEFISYSKALSLPPMKGSNLAIMSTFGGQAVISADVASQYGFSLPAIPDSVLEAVARRQRANVVKLGNPMDLGDVLEMEAYQAAFEAVIALPEIDGIVMIIPYTPAATYGTITTKPLLRHMRELSTRLGKPVAFSMMSHPAILRQLQEEENMTYFVSPEEAIEALAVSRDYHKQKGLPPQAPPQLEVDREEVARLLEKANGRLSAPEASLILHAYGIPVVEASLCRSPEEAVEAARRLGYPVVLKVESPDISHKSDVGGVAIGIADEEAMREAYRSITKAASARVPGARLEGVLVQPMVRGREVILGARQDESFGPVVMFGLGGIHVEVLKDVTFRVAPISLREAEEMVREIKALPILEGVRGQPPADLPFLADCLVRLSRLATDFPQIRELDVNPLMVFPQGEGGLAVDVRMMVGEEG